MYSVNAKIMNSFYSEASEKYDESFRIQLLGESPLKDGQVKMEMLTLSVPKDIYSELKSKVGKTVSLPIGFFVSNNRLTPFFPKNTSLQKIQKNSGTTSPSER